MVYQKIKGGAKKVKKHAKVSLKHIKSVVGKSIWELLLLVVIILNILDFFELLNPDFDYIKKIISWTILGYLLYNIDLSKIIFGESNKKFNLYLILTFFLMEIKNFLIYSFSILQEMQSKGITHWAELKKTVYNNSQALANNTFNFQTDINGNLANLPNQALNPILQKITLNETINSQATALTIDPSQGFPFVNYIFLNISNTISNIMFTLEPKYAIHRWHSFITENALNFLTIPLIIGILTLFILSMYATKNMKIHKPSLMHIIHFNRLRKIKFFSPIIRFLTIFLVLNFFFIIVFSFMMEWLAIAIDASLLIAGILFYVWLSLVHKHRFSTESLIIKLGDIGEDFYERFLKLFHSEKGILLAFSGLIILHLIVDIGVFLVPHATGIHDSLYFEQLSKAKHQPIFNLLFLSEDKSSIFTDDLLNESATILEKTALLPLYLLNIIGLLYLLAIPGFLWATLLKKKEYKIPDFMISLFYSSLIALIFTNAFKIKRISTDGLAGLDIQTTSILIQSATRIIGTLIVSILIFFIVQSTIKKHHKIREYFLIIGFIPCLIFLGYYVLIYILEHFAYYTKTISSLLASLSMNDLLHSLTNIILSIEFGFFLIIVLIFYIFGFFVFLYEVIKE